MDDSKQYNNDGTEVNLPELAPIEVPPHRPRRPLARIALIFIILGTVMIGAGWVSGSRGGRVHFANGLRIESFRRNAIQGDMSAETFYDSLNTHTVEVSTFLSNITIVPTSDPYPRVVSSSRTPLDMSVTDGRLRVNAPGVERAFMHMFNMQLVFADISFSNYMHNGVRYNYLEFELGSPFRRLHRNNIRIYAPSTVNHFDVNTTTGTIRISDIDTSSVNLRTTTGNIHFSDGQLPHGYMRTNTGTIRVSLHENTSTHLQAQTSTGNIHFGGGWLQNSEFRTNTGTIRVDAQIVGSFSANATTGNIHINDYSLSHEFHGGDGIQIGATTGTIRFSTNAPESDFNYNMSISTGTMRTNGVRRDTRNFSGGSGNMPLNVRATTGNIHLNFEE